MCHLYLKHTKSFLLRDSRGGLHDLCVPAPVSPSRRATCLPSPQFGQAPRSHAFSALAAGLPHGAFLSEAPPPPDRTACLCLRIQQSLLPRSLPGPRSTSLLARVRIPVPEDPWAQALGPPPGLPLRGSGAGTGRPLLTASQGAQGCWSHAENPLPFALHACVPPHASLTHVHGEMVHGSA